MIRKGFLRPIERLLLHPPMVWALYPTIGWFPIRSRVKTEPGQLFRKY